jgi:hypothetical protein
MLYRALQRVKRRLMEQLWPTPVTGFDRFRLLTEKHRSDKWHGHDYVAPYFSHFRDFEQKPIRLMEIGVGGYQDDETGYRNPALGGDSLRFWKEYFVNGEIFAIDVEDKTIHQEDRITIFQGSQIDAVFLSRVLQRIGPLDIIIDDGSHVNSHVITTFELLFPHLNEGGLYVVEDTQTSYWPGDYGGDAVDRNNSQTMMGYFKGLVDGLNHAEFPDEQYEAGYFEKYIVSISFFHNLIFIRKGQNDGPSNMVRKSCPRG